MDARDWATKKAEEDMNAKPGLEKELKETKKLLEEANRYRVEAYDLYGKALLELKEAHAKGRAEAFREAANRCQECGDETGCMDCTDTSWLATEFAQKAKEAAGG